MQMSRRSLLAALGATAGAAALAGHGFTTGPGAPNWQIGYANAPAGGFAPRSMDLISGRLPDGFSGTLYRNGPAWFSYGGETLDHWFDGDGMVQRIALRDGQAVHTGKFVATNKHRSEQAAGRFLAPGFGSAGDESYPVMGVDDANAANTSVLVVDGRLHALWEAGSAMELDPITLETLGARSWREDLKGMPFLAHPKVEPDGTVWNLAVAGSKVGIYRISPKGAVQSFDMLDLGVTPYLHDWAITERHLILMIQPWLMTKFIPPFVDTLQWRPEEGLKLLIIDKADMSSRRSAEVEGHAFFHTGAAWEDASGAIHIDVALYDEPFLGSGGGTNLMQGRYIAAEDDANGVLSRIIVEADGRARIQKTDIDGEFPVVHPAFHGLGRRLTALVGGSSPGRPGARKVSLMDWRSGKTSHFDYGASRVPEEHLFVAKPGGRGEHDAWLVGTALNIASGRSEVHVFDVADISEGPVASFAARYAWPLGFHGTFAPG
ncbi:MAG: carotenoid oxygenase family protein [Hyphomonadaceae bacterium]|nr:carotenoid oxygenase family protein [Hyphomonadaceae bacterium]